MSLMRIQKILSYAGVCSRRKAESYVLDGAVSINGCVIKVLGAKADPDIDVVCVNGKRITIFSKFIYIALNKPIGYVSTCLQTNTKTVLDLINIQNRLFPVGRLDKDSTGLLLMTNDGRIHHKLSHPSFRHEKEYFVETMKPISDSALSAMRKGIILEGRPTLPSKIVRVSSRKFKIILTEGRNRQIRRMVGYQKNKVMLLKRIRVDEIRLNSLKEGLWRYLRNREIEELLQSLGLT